MDGPKNAMDKAGKIRITFRVSLIEGQDPEVVAQRICTEQTVELPQDLVDSQRIREHVVGSVKTIVPKDDHVYLMDIDFDLDTTGRQVPQLLNVLFGNISLMPGTRIDDVTGLTQFLPGPKFGITGLRELCGQSRGALVCTALKPMGKSVTELAKMAHDLALGGIHIIKDDHGLCNQPYAPFRQRVESVSDAVRSANEKTGGNCLYFPHFAPPVEHVNEALDWCVSQKIKGLLVCPFLVGLDYLRFLTQKAPFALMAHPAMSGALFATLNHGMRPGFVLGKLFRYLGADASIYPNVGGRFVLDAAVCQEINGELRQRHPLIRRAFPVPAGGMALNQIPRVRELYGDDVIILIGGHLFRTDSNLTKAAEKFLAFARGKKS